MKDVELRLISELMKTVEEVIENLLTVLSVIDQITSKGIARA